MKPSISAVAVLLAAVLALGCGQSKEEKASKQVCNARTDLQKQVDQLAGLTAATATADGVKANLQAIRDDLSKIADAQGDLNDARKKQVQEANQKFTSQLKSIAGDLGTSVSAGEAKTQLQDATQALSASYSDSFAQVDCG